jgi:hypothetical protein
MSEELLNIHHLRALASFGHRQGPDRSGLPDELIERLQRNSAPAQRKIDGCFEPF